MIYADYASTTPIDPVVLEAMMPYLTSEFYNPSSVYPKGMQTKSSVDAARESLARLLGTSVNEIIFTSGGSESNNLAIKGVALHPDNTKRHIITTAIEHHSVLTVCEYLENVGYRVSYLSVDRHGLVDPDELRQIIDKDTALVSVMYVNNELGSIQNIKQLCEIAHEYGAFFHTDAVQAFCTEDFDVKQMGVDLFSMSSHKFYGPKGIGLLYCREGINLLPQIHGGQQEGHRRAGTEPVAQIVGMAKAAELAQAKRADLRRQLQKQKEILLQGMAALEDVIINSPQSCTSPAVLNIGQKDIEAEGVVLRLAMQGIMVSMGAACNTQSLEPSHVIKAIGLEDSYLRGCIRISLGKGITDSDCCLIAESIVHIVNKIKR